MSILVYVYLNWLKQVFHAFPERLLNLFWQSRVKIEGYSSWSIAYFDHNAITFLNLC